MMYYLVFFIPPLLFSLWAQAKVKGSFKKYSKVGISSGMTGAEAAYQMLQANGLRNVGIERAQGFLSDHYDPRKKVLRLSPDVHDGRSVAAVGVACHEAGHALQDAANYLPLQIRSLAVPAASFGNWLAMPLIMLGLFFQMTGLSMLGLIAFAAIVAFQIITLPVEFDASSRAKKALLQMGIVAPGQEAAGVSKTLNAAALTYVAATVAAISQLLYYAMLVLGNRR